MSKQCGEPLILLYHTPNPKLNKSNIRSSLLVKISTPFKPAYFFTRPNGLQGGGSNFDRQRHSSYKSKPPQPAVVYFFQAGVLFSIENAHFGPIFLAIFGYLVLQEVLADLKSNKIKGESD